MANLTESSVFENGVYQLETDDPVLGGTPAFDAGIPVTGHANAQAQQLANRTKYLKQAQENFANDLADATDPAKGAGMVGFQQAGAGAIARTMLDKAREYITPEDFGAIGDGVADDTVAFLDAVTAAGGGELRIAGAYRVSAVVTLENIRLAGQGSITKTARTNMHLFEIGSNVTIDGITLKSVGASVNGSSILYLTEAAKNLRFVGVSFIDLADTYSALSASSSAGGALYTVNVSDVLVDSCRFEGFSRPVYLSCVDHLKILDCTFDGCRYDAIRTRKNMEHILVDGNTFRNIGVYPPPDAQTRDALDTKWAGRSLIFSNNIVDKCACIGVDIKGVTEGSINEETGDEASSRRIIIEGNIFKDCWAGGVSISDTPSSVVNVGNNIIQSTPSPSTGAAGIYVEGAYINVHHNHLIDCGRGIMVASAAKSVLIDGNHFINNMSLDLRVDATSPVLICNNIFNGHDATQVSRVSASCTAFLIGNIPGKNISFDGNTFIKPGAALSTADINFGSIRRWSNNTIKGGLITLSDNRIYRDATIFHSDRGHTSARGEAMLANYNLGDAIIQYGATTQLMIVGLDTGTALGSADVVRQSWQVTTAANFDFTSLAVGDWITFSGGVLGSYQVVEFDSVAKTITVDVALERSATGVTVSKRPKKMFSVALA